jgi:S1-C subfamily serine protease
MMKKAPLYSRSPTRSAAPQAEPMPDVATPEPGSTVVTGSAAGSARRSRLKTFAARHERQLWASALLLFVVCGLALNASTKPGTAPLTMKQIDYAMRKSIEVVGLMTDGDDGGDIKDDAKNGKTPVERGVGTGVVIIDNGTILTNLHVINGAKRIRVSFMDGTESDAQLLSVQPENDLAVLRARTIPDDLQAATMRSTGDLAPGDRVIAVGFPFGIGPSVSDGVVSGLKREFRSPEGQQTMSNLIQFDAAANPGNSGGPLVTMDGEVVGIVTAILNPSRQRVFIGIGFAVPIENAAAAAGMPPF